MYDLDKQKIKKVEFFTSNINIEKTYWFYLDKYEDVSIYYFKNEYIQQQQKLAQSPNTNMKQIDQSMTASCSNNQTSSLATISSSNSNNLNYSTSTTSTTSTSIVSTSTQSQSKNKTTNISSSEIQDINLLNEINLTFNTSIDSCLYLPQKNENFNNKLKLWKCCTLIKHQNITLEKILNRLKNERQLWDDDFKEGKVVEQLDENTELYRYVITFMPPHPSRDFFEIRHESITPSSNPIAVLTSTSVQQKPGNKLIGDIRANMLISKYVIEKLIATDTTTTFKITHYVKLDYK